MKTYRTTSCAEFARLASEQSEERLIIHRAFAPCAWTGRLRTLNESECRRRGIPIGRGEYIGGSIVCMPGDLSLCLMSWGNSDFAPALVEAAADWLTERGIAVERDNNDVLADGKKVISWARATTVRGWTQSVVHFSVGPMDIGLVRAICTKPMAKEPGSLGEYGITAELILSALRDNIIFAEEGGEHEQ